MRQLLVHVVDVTNSAFGHDEFHEIADVDDETLHDFLLRPFTAKFRLL